jgi:uncharacterized protein YndB with AHSA1/START domain
MDKPGLIAKAAITINATANKVWEALVNPLMIKEYMFGATVHSDWVKGSPITWKGEINGKQFEDKGEILAIEPGKKLQYSHYSPLSKLPDIPSNYHIVTIKLADEKGKTIITLEQDKNGSEKEQQEAQKNWNTMLQSLKKLLET